MTQAIEAYRAITATDRFREIERMRDKARHDEAQALLHARETAIEETNAKWQSVVTDKDAALAEQAAEIARLRALLEQG